MPFVALPTELAKKITLNSRRKEKDKVIVIQYGEGYKQTMDDGLNPIEDVWNLEFAPLNADLRTTMTGFRRSVGSSKSFTWTPPGESVSKKWRIEKDTFDEQLVSPSLWKVTFTITQSFELG